MLKEISFVWTVRSLICSGVFLCAGVGWAQEAPAQNDAAARAARIQALQAQAARIRNELEALKQAEEKKKPAVAKKRRPTAKPPEGITRSEAMREEFTEQPTRHMRESLESLPGMTVRQGEGPRDFDISIRGSGK